MKPDPFFLKNGFLAFAAFLLTCATYRNFGRELTYAIPVSVGLLTFFTYQLAAWHPAVSGKGIVFIKKTSKWQMIFTFLTGGTGLYLYPGERIEFIFLPGFFTFLYFLQWPAGILKGGLRSVFLMKNVLVALIWILLTLNLPLYPQMPNPLTWLARFILIFIITLGLDLRDTEVDLQGNVQTLPGRLGFEKAKQWILLLVFTSFIFFFFMNFPGHPAILKSLFVAGTVVSFLKPETGYWKYFLLLDGILVLHALFLLF